MTLRLVLGDGAMTVVRFPGGKADVGQRAGPGPDSKSVVARPDGNLHELVAQGGQVKLLKGTYRLERPLVLPHPIAITAEPGATLVFAQKPGDAPLDGRHQDPGRACHARRLRGAVRGSGPLARGNQLRPGGHRRRDGFDPPSPAVLADLTFTKLDLQAPPASGRAAWEDAVNLIRLAGAVCGKIENCTLRGGPMEFFGGPWRIVGNEHQGVPTGTSSPCVFAGHYVHDLLIRDNKTRLVAPAGKTWRFLVLTGAGFNVLVDANRVEGVGPRDDDTIPGANSPSSC